MCRVLVYFFFFDGYGFSCDQTSVEIHWMNLVVTVIVVGIPIKTVRLSVLWLAQVCFRG